MFCSKRTFKQGCYKYRVSKRRTSSLSPALAMSVVARCSSFTTYIVCIHLYQLCYLGSKDLVVVWARAIRFIYRLSTFTSLEIRRKRANCQDDQFQSWQTDIADILILCLVPELLNKIQCITDTRRKDGFSTIFTAGALLRSGALQTQYKLSQRVN